MKHLARLSIFIHTGIFSTSQLVCIGGYFIWVVADANHCGHIPGIVNIGMS